VELTQSIWLSQAVVVLLKVVVVAVVFVQVHNR
jgi:hypothetical protein